MLRVLLTASALMALSGCAMVDAIASWFGPRTTLDAPDTEAWAKHFPWNSASGDVKKTGSGVEYVVLGSGPAGGASPAANSIVEVHYEGRLNANGSKFDSSFDREETASFPVDGVIPGFGEALQKMHPGDSWLVFIPSRLAYGSEARGDVIPANSDLIFEVELKSIIGSDAAAWAKYFPWNSSRPEVRKTGSGLEYVVVTNGPAGGAPPKEGQQALIRYAGRLEQGGKQIVSTFEQGDALAFPVSDMTPGFNELMKLMKPGDRLMARVPPSLMYGNEGDGRIPPNATVIYEVEMIAVM